MKKIIWMIISFFIIILLTIMLLIFKNDNNKKNKLIVAEVTHSVFYAPWYVALKNNYFDDLDIEVILTSGANNVISAVLSGDASIGLCGPEATIYLYNNNKEDYIKSFSALTKKDGQFLILRNNIKLNSIEDLNNKTILAGRSGGMPLLNFKNALKNYNIKNVNIDSSIDFANLTSSFISGNGDGVNLFEPNATTLVKKGYGYIAYNIGNLSGDVPYTTFNAKVSFINSNKDIINKFKNGIQKGLDYVSSHTASEIAEIIKDEFPDTDINDLENMINNYKENDTWYTTTKINEEDFKRLEDIMIDNNEIKDYVNFNELIYE